MSDLSLNPEQSESQHKSLSQSGSPNQPESSMGISTNKSAFISHGKVAQVLVDAIYAAWNSQCSFMNAAGAII
ncbi:unnamed protein product [Fusarium graminearum]|uniref:Chromosome 2, complete genome n=2 Tax=Gibberella zeae TaxID=5518 RepID=A0A098DI25_GIBZE|nr:unnamed protein product [Fusarium graminearum]CAG2008750.1 unnamed protein product [Fusarium graminearum]CEF78608.1 unnamed protein product [Fusarium graminearum]CZS81901.1 unnamed protein product [Fusarium graminearum]